MAKQKSAVVLREEREQLAAKIKQLDAAIRAAEQREEAEQVRSLLSAARARGLTLEDVLRAAETAQPAPPAKSVEEVSINDL